MTNSIYARHDRVFANVSAYVICDKEGSRVATVAFKFGQAVTAFVHIIGDEMQQAMAKGGGYDRQSAAVASAARKMHEDPLGDTLYSDTCKADAIKLRAAMALDGGKGWQDAVRDAGFDVWQAV